MDNRWRGAWVIRDSPIPAAPDKEFEPRRSCRRAGRVAEHPRQPATPGLGGSGFGFLARRCGWSGGRSVGGSGCDGGLGSRLGENPGRKRVGTAGGLAWDTPAGPSIVVVATVLFALGLGVEAMVRGRVG